MKPKEKKNEETIRIPFLSKRYTSNSKRIEPNFFFFSSSLPAWMHVRTLYLAHRLNQRKLNGVKDHLIWVMYRQPLFFFCFYFIENEVRKTTKTFVTMGTRLHKKSKNNENTPKALEDGAKNDETAKVILINL